jgi:hypothetical protein
MAKAIYHRATRPRIATNSIQPILLMNSQMSKASRRVRFEEVTPTHEYAAFFNVSIAPLVAHLGLPIFDGYDDLDDLQLAFLTLISRTLGNALSQSWLGLLPS